MSGYSAEVQASLIMPTGAEAKFFNADDAKANGWKYDAAAAEKLLTDAGAKKGDDGIYVLDGTRLGPYKLITPTGWTDWNAACEIVAKSLKAVGIDCSTNFPQQAETTQAIQGGSLRPGLLVRLRREPGHPVGAVQGHHEPVRGAAAGQDHLRQLRPVGERRGRGTAHRGFAGCGRHRQEGRLRQAGLPCTARKFRPAR